jgi:hypothetical protein
MPDDEGQQVRDADAEGRDVGGGPDHAGGQLWRPEQGLVDQAASISP